MGTASEKSDEAIEAGILPLFRLFVVLAILLLLVRALLDALAVELPLAAPPWTGIAGLVVFLGYLSWPTLQRRLGRRYLPIAIAFAGGAAVLGSAATLRLRLAVGMGREALAQGAWLLVALLLVPAILAAWQYGFAWALWFCLLTAAADIALKAPLAPAAGPTTLSIVIIALVRCLIFLPVSYAVARLAQAQRERRDALAQANARLARHAGTLEQLAVSQERNRLARELHDTLAHGLSGVAVQLEAMSVVWDSRPQATRAMLADALAVTRSSLYEARRAIGALRASPLADLGLAKAIRELAESTARRTDLRLDLQLPDCLEGLDPEVEQTFYRVAAEALANVARHAQARHLTLRLEESARQVDLLVADDGRGFDPAATASGERFGLRGMRERAAAVGVELAVESVVGKGTNVRLAARRAP